MKFSLLFLFLATAVLARAAEPKPNILFCFADDWGRYASVYKGVDGRPTMNDIVQTPNIDRVAKAGVTFKNAFVGSPSCTPCRSALLSGRYFYRTGMGAILNGAEWDPKIPSWPLLLHDAGYHIGKAYKVWSPGTPANAPYGEEKYAYEKAGKDFSNFSENVTAAVEKGVKVEEAKAKILAQVHDNFAAFLNARPAGQPFCFWFGPTNTHRKWVKGSGKALWGLEPEALKGKLPAFLPDVPEVREDVADYLGEAQAWDAGIGVLLKELEARGELAKTLVVISGDHGMGGMPRGKCNLYDFGTAVALVAAGPGVKGGRMVDDFVWLPDLAATFLEVGAVPPPPGMNAKSILNVLRSDRSGQVDPERTWVLTGRERHVAVAREGNLPYPQRAIRTKEFLYIRNFAPDRWPMGSPRGITDTEEPSEHDLENNTVVTFADMDSSPTKAYFVAHRHETEGAKFFDLAFGKRPGEELYDLAKDPDEVTNVAAQPAYAKTRQEMAARLQKLMVETEDPRLQDAYDRPPFTTAGVENRKGKGKGGGGE